MALEASQSRRVSLVAETLAEVDPLLVKAIRLQKQGLLSAPVTTDIWPVDYERVKAWRAYKMAWFRGSSDRPEGTTDHEIERLISSDSRVKSAKAFYAKPENCTKFINHWLDTHDPRNAGLVGVKASLRPVTMPLILFQRQEDLVSFVLACMAAEAAGLVEKSRDMGATWVCIGISVWMWLFHAGASVGWGSATATKLDRSGDSSSIFEKIEMCIKGLPTWLMPKGLKPDKHLLDKRIFNPENGASIVGEIGPQIGRGGRTRVYFVDEAAHLEQPEEVEKALSETTRVRIDVSSVSGLGTVFHRTRKGGVDWEVGREIVRDKTNVFVMDWMHHPAKNKDWYDTKAALYESKGMSHVFAQEISRDYSAAVEGTVLPRPWLDSCLNAHLKLNWDDEGGWVAGLDVYDAGLDANAWVARKGWVIKVAHEWMDRDTAVTTRRALGFCREHGVTLMEYDCVGIGSGVKAEANRLMDDGKFPKSIVLVPWNAGAAVLDPYGRVVPGDDKSPRNKDYYSNLKAQGWWNFRQRVYRTHLAVTTGEAFKPDDLVSFDTKSIGSKMLVKLLEELGQATASTNTRMKLVVDKNPDGTKSPNLGDATIINAFPIIPKPTMTALSFALPIQVSAGLNCANCGSRRIHELSRSGRYQCHNCGHMGDR